MLCHRVVIHGPPFSKGTEAICRVPSIYLSHRLGALTPIHLCWFGVRLYILIYAISWRTFYSLLNIRLLISVKSFPSHIVYPSVYGIDHYLRGRFTLHRIPCCRNPWIFGDPGFHRIWRYSCQHSHFRYLQYYSHNTFINIRNVLLPQSFIWLAAASVHIFSSVTL